MTAPTRIDVETRQDLHGRSAAEIAPPVRQIEPEVGLELASANLALVFRLGSPTSPRTVGLGHAGGIPGAGRGGGSCGVGRTRTAEFDWQRKRPAGGISETTGSRAGVIDTDGLHDQWLSQDSGGLATEPGSFRVDVEAGEDLSTLASNGGWLALKPVTPAIGISFAVVEDGNDS